MAPFRPPRRLPGPPLAETNYARHVGKKRKFPKGGGRRATIGHSGRAGVSERGRRHDWESRFDGEVVFSPKSVPRPRREHTSAKEGSKEPPPKVTFCNDKLCTARGLEAHFFNICVLAYRMDSGATFYRKVLRVHAGSMKMRKSSPTNGQPLKPFWRSFAALGAPWPPQWAQEMMHATWVRSTILQKGRYGAQRGGALLQK